jgi:hypothetical protein
MEFEKAKKDMLEKLRREKEEKFGKKFGTDAPVATI